MIELGNGLRCEAFKRWMTLHLLGIEHSHSPHGDVPFTDARELHDLNLRPGLSELEQLHDPRQEQLLGCTEPNPNLMETEWYRSAHG